MKLGRAGHNRRKPKEQKVNEHSFPWLPYLTPLFSTHTSCYSAPFVLSVRSSSRAEQERALPRHVPAVTHGSRAQCWDQHCRARHKNMFRPLTARLKSVHTSVLRHFPDSLLTADEWWQKWQETGKWQSWSSCTEEELCALPQMQALCSVQLFAIYHLGIWLLLWLTPVCLIISICNWILR